MEIMSACNVTEKLTEDSMHCFQCSGTNDVIYLIPYQRKVHIDVHMTSSRRHSAKVRVTIVDNSI